MILQHHCITSDAFHPNRRQADSVVQAIAKSKRIIVVTGAGISVSGGIPDFRSIDGLYNIVKSKYPHAVVKGRDLFDANLFKDPVSTSVFYSFMGELKDLVEAASCTRSHRFIQSLKDRKKLLRCYTQNIDCLEERLGLNCDISDKKSHVVPLHGTLNFVVCTVCKLRLPFDQEHKSVFKEGTAPPCPDCQEKNEVRKASNRRELAVGTLRPDIILYNEHHAAGDMIGERAAADLGKRPDLLIVMGTSLKVPGIKRMVKDITRQIRAMNGSEDAVEDQQHSRLATILINKTELVGVTEWKQVFDVCWIGDADEIVHFIESNLREIDSQAEDRRRRRQSAKRAKEQLMVNQRLITDCLSIRKHSLPLSPPLALDDTEKTCSETVEGEIKRSASVSSVGSNDVAKENAGEITNSALSAEVVVAVVAAAAAGSKSKSATSTAGLSKLKVRIKKSSSSQKTAAAKKQPSAPPCVSHQKPKTTKQMTA